MNVPERYVCTYVYVYVYVYRYGYEYVCVVLCVQGCVLLLSCFFLAVCTRCMCFSRRVCIFAQCHFLLSRPRSLSCVSDAGCWFMDR